MLIAYNIDKIDKEKVKDYILSELNDLKAKGEITVSTHLKRLALIYDSTFAPDFLAARLRIQHL